MVAVILGQGGTQDYQVEGFPLEGIQHRLPALRLADLVARFFNRNRLCGKDFMIAFRIQNLQF
jgi:hypothetical protein